MWSRTDAAFIRSPQNGAGFLSCASLGPNTARIFTLSATETDPVMLLVDVNTTDGTVNHATNFPVTPGSSVHRAGVWAGGDRLVSVLSSEEGAASLTLAWYTSSGSQLMGIDLSSTLFASGGVAGVASAGPSSFLTMISDGATVATLKWVPAQTTIGLSVNVTEVLA